MGFASWHWSELYLGGMHVNTYTNGSTYFSHADHLGSERMETDPTGNTNSSATTNLPFGEWTSAGMQSELGFTGDLLDDADGDVFHTPNRQLSQTQGRWMVPDPAGLAAVNPWNPQTWNRYAYVENNPTSYVDPSGLARCLCWAPQGGGGFGGLYAMTGGNAYNTQMNAFIQSQIGAGNVVDCGGQCDPGNPKQVGQPGMDNSIYGWTHYSGAQTTVDDPNIFVIKQVIGGWGYGVIGTLNPTDFGTPDDDLLAQNQAPQNAANNGTPQQPQSPQQPQQSRLNQASKAALHTFVFGQAIGTGVGCGVGALVAAGGTAATETYPLAGATVPAGCVGGGIIGFFEALPYSTLGAIADFGWTYWGH